MSASTTVAGCCLSQRLLRASNCSNNISGNLCPVLQGEVYGYKHALAISQYEVEDAPMRDRERVTAYIRGVRKTKRQFSFGFYAQKQLLLSARLGSSIKDVHTEGGGGSSLMWTKVDKGRGGFQ